MTRVRADEMPLAAQPLRIETFSGEIIDLNDPKIAAFDENDIAWPLARMCRYNGAFPGFYSVAEHSLLVERFARQLYPSGGPVMHLAALLHDAAEAFVGDLIAPIKERLIAYQALEHGLMREIADRFGFLDMYANPKNWALIEDADELATLHELDYRKARIDRTESPIRCLPPDKARMLFSDRVRQATKRAREWNARQANQQGTR